MTKHIETSIEVDVPVRTAYDQWTQFEDFPLFMRDIDEIEQIDDKTLHWKATVRGVTREWSAQITEQTPDARIAWTSEDGPHNAGVVTFHKLDDSRTKVMLQLDHEPEGLAERYAEFVGLIEQRAEQDMADFKAFIEKRGKATGAWRGEIDGTSSADNSGSAAEGREPLPGAYVS